VSPLKGAVIREVVPYFFQSRLFILGLFSSHLTFSPVLFFTRNVDSFSPLAKTFLVPPPPRLGRHFVLSHFFFGLRPSL